MTRTEDLCTHLVAGRRDELARRQLARFVEREATVRAFAAADVDAARAELERSADGPLGGVLFAAKDTFATADLPTSYGLAAPPVPPPQRDAWVIARARAAGAVLLGKAACTPLGVPKAPATTNPHDAARTPGGSSSGSAAAVGADFVAFAFASQTAGSAIRPAAYCGATGYKPSFGLLPVDGLAALAPTLDHVALITASPRDAWYVASALIAPRAETLLAVRPRRVALLDLPGEAAVDAAYAPLLEQLAAQLLRAEIAVEHVPLPVPWELFTSLNQRICYWEAARQLDGSPAAPSFAEMRHSYEPQASASLESYLSARRLAEAQRHAFELFAGPFDMVLMPAARGPAPPREQGTGDAVLNRFWTALHVPVLTLPLWRDGPGLPLGLQAIGRFGTDRALVAHSQWLCEAADP